ncbi:hypothetical protein NX784_12625 [Massilia pinisoli]|uniref:Uncharacterized protein n=1 Tax=Massilia pinisoli TaxID=1772194 RepID=A0ABT1ZRC5_9BURK|nr:hypothetical protein [Massilia pinisoli]MCS0582437.1 hypothetical protein [Massilia pinisoli]
MNNIARGILTAFLCVMLAGFGLCGAAGTISGLAGMSSPGPENFSSIALVFGLIGLGIALVCGLALFRLWRKRPPAVE